LIACNAVRLRDLLHVIPLAELALRPILLANPELPTLNLLLLVGVPLFIAPHIIILRNLIGKVCRRGRAGHV
jgi:hypothetical protein